MSRRIICLILFFLFLQICPAKTQTGQNGINDKRTTKLRPVSLIDLPTANFISISHFQMRLRVYAMGGMLGGLRVGLTPRLMFGVTYGGQNLIGHGAVKWNGAPGVNLRYRIRFEDMRFPAVSVGFNSQGYGTYYEKLDRYQIKSVGFYVVGSKNYSLLKDLGIHGGINYSSENRGTEKDINFFMGAHLFLDREITLLWEYDLAVNDNDENSIGKGSGYMNAGIRVAFLQNFILEFSIKNLLKNTRDKEDIEKIKDDTKIDELPRESRELKIIYYQEF